MIYLPDNAYNPPLFRGYQYILTADDRPIQYGNDRAALEELRDVQQRTGGATLRVYNVDEPDWLFLELRVRQADRIEKRFNLLIWRLTQANQSDRVTT